ncbi:MAG: Fe2+-dependent dioxygenase [Pseudomonadota bacterium]
MILPISKVVQGTVLASLQQLGERDPLFRDGNTTAGWHARGRKQNLQADTQQDEVASSLKTVHDMLLKNGLIQAAARPRQVVRMMLSRYDRGMHYGNHVDNAMMDGQRTDLSFTLFLTDSDAYEGGELIMDGVDGPRAFRLNAGDMLLYPSTTLHRVNPVTEGRRLAIVGWIRSHVRDPAQREILFDLDRVIHELRQGPVADEMLSLLLKTRSNLLRRWVD